MTSEQKVLGSFLKANLAGLYRGRKTTFGGSLVFKGSSAQRDDNVMCSILIQTHYVCLVDLVNAQRQKFLWACKQNRDWLLQQKQVGRQEGASEHRGRRDHISLEATVEAVPAVAQKGWGQCQIVLNELSCPYREMPRKAANLCQQSRVSADDLWQEELIKRSVHIPAALDQLGWEKNEGKMVSCCIPAYLWWGCNVTLQLRILGTEILSSLQWLQSLQECRCTYSNISKSNRIVRKFALSFL